MNAHKVQTTLTENGQLTLENIPFVKGELVEVILKIIIILLASMVIL